MKRKIKTVLKILSDILLRKNKRNITFISGNTTWKECIIILSSLFMGKNIVNGNHIQKYEYEFRKYLGIKYSFSFGAGRMAFYAILKAMEIKEGDEVILPAYTCVVVPDAIIYCGAKPVYVDIDSDTLNIDVNKIEEKITSKTKIIYVQHTFASFCDMDSIFRIAKKYNLKIVEDCAHALGAQYDGKMAGTFGDAAYFTTEQSKIISTGMGGMAVTNDEKIALKIKEIQSQSEFYDKKTIKKIALQIVLYNILFHPKLLFITKYILYMSNQSNIFVQSTTKKEMEGEMPEKYPVRLSNIQAHIGLSQLKSINENLIHRRKIAKFYRDSFQKLNYQVPENKNLLYNPAYIRYWFFVEDRKKMQKIFQHNEIELGEWFNSPLHPVGSSLKNLCYQKGSFPIAEYVTEHNVNLPTHMKVSYRDVARIINILEKECEPYTN